MEKFIPLNQTGAPNMINCKKSGHKGCHPNQEALSPLVLDRLPENNAGVLQLFYTMLIQYHSSGINNKSGDTSYLHCT
jgi:hypothetical protein